MQDKIWLSSPHLGGEEKRFVNEAIDTNWVAPLGPNVNGFEEDLQAYTQVQHAAALSSGTAALHLALILAGVEQDDYVICQSFTFCGSANPIAYQKAIPVFVDSEPNTWNISPEYTEQAIKDCMAGRFGKAKKPKAIVPVHLYGMPAKMDELRALSEQYEIPIIEDAAEALGSTYKGQPCGGLGDFGVLSFNGNKIITTSGGGALLSNSEKLIQKARFLATQARDNAPHYEHTQIGFNYRMSNICAGIGRGQMLVLEDRVNQRRLNYQAYIAFFKAQAKEVGKQEGAAEMVSNRWLSTFLFDSFEERERIRLGLEESNIESRPLWKPMHMQPVFTKAPYVGEKVAENLFDKGLCLPSGSNLKSKDFERIFSGLERLI